jgi:hypothetical protein
MQVNVSGVNNSFKAVQQQFPCLLAGHNINEELDSLAVSALRRAIAEAK